MRRVKPGALGRLRWAIRTGRRPTSFAGLLRLWWADFILHPLFEIGERCQDCGRKFPLWRAPDDLYAEVYGSLRGVLCPGCFDRQAEAMGIVIRFEAREVGRRHNAPSRRSQRYTPELPGLPPAIGGWLPGRMRAAGNGGASIPNLGEARGQHAPGN